MVRFPLRYGVWLLAGFLTTVGYSSVLNAQDATLNFVNRSSGDVELFWLNEKGEQVSYGVVKKGKTVEQGTFRGHQWLIRDAQSGQLLARVTARFRTQDVVIADSTPNPAPNNAEAELTVNNQSKATVELFWINERGKEQSVAKIPPGGNTKGNSTVGHRFVFRNADTGKEVSTFTVGKVKDEVTITDPTPPPVDNKAELTVVNKMEKSFVELFSINDQGNEMSESIVKPGGNVKLNTTLGKQYVLREVTGGKEVTRFTVAKKTHQVTAQDAAVEKGQLTIANGGTINADVFSVEKNNKETLQGAVEPGKSRSFEGTVGQVLVVRASGENRELQRVTLTGSNAFIQVVPTKTTPGKVTVPNLVNTTSSVAESALAALGLKGKAKEGDQTSDRSRVGIIHEQDPQPGASVAAGTTITYTYFISTNIVVNNVTTYWLGRKPDPAKNVYVFDTRAPDDFAAMIAASEPKYEKYRSGVKSFDWVEQGKTYSFLQNKIGWAGNLNEALTYDRSDGIGYLWSNMKAGPEWTAVQKELKLQALPWNNNDQWKTVSPTLLKTDSTTNPNLTVNFDTDRPFHVVLDGPGVRGLSINDPGTSTSKKPQIVPVVVNDELYLGWNVWNYSSINGKVVVSKISLDKLNDGKLTSVRELKSAGRLVGFTVDNDGADYILHAKDEQFDNNPKGNFIAAIHNTWRTGSVVLTTRGTDADLASDTFADWKFYGLTNSGSGRLGVSPTSLVGVFARREYSQGDGLIHQVASDLLMDKDRKNVQVKAGNVVSHSFDQRLIFDGTDFLTLHQGDAFPNPGLLIEKVRTNPGNQNRIARHTAFSCPTVGNDIYFELGGIVADQKGYPVVFTATRNTTAIRDTNEKYKMAWDLGMVYVVRDFDTKTNPANPHDILGSGILSNGVGQEEDIKADGLNIKRRVLWLTQNDLNTKATNAKLVRLREGEYIAVWEEFARDNETLGYSTTRALRLSFDGKTVTKGKAVELKGTRLNQGDDAFQLNIGRSSFAGWVTSGSNNKQMLLHTLDENMTYKGYPLQIP